MFASAMILGLARGRCRVQQPVWEQPSRTLPLYAAWSFSTEPRTGTHSWVSWPQGR